MSPAISSDRRLRCLIVSGVNITRLPKPPIGEQPERDFQVLQSLYDTEIVDSENYLAVGGRTAAMVNRRMGPKWGVAAAALFRARLWGAQVIIAMGDDIGVPLGALLQAARLRIPYLMTTQHAMSKRPAFILGVLRIHSPFSRFMCMAEAQARFLSERYGVSESRLSTIYWYTDHRFYRPMPEISVKRQICSAGMTSRDYLTMIQATRGLNVDVLIEANSAWFNNGVNFSKEELHDRVEICGYGTSVGLRQLYAESEVVVLPLVNVPHVVGYSTLLESMAMAKPVIASRTPMIGDFIEDGWNGFYVRPGDPDDMRRKITYLLDHPAEARRMGQNARKTIEERFTIDHYRYRVDNLVREVTEPVHQPVFAIP